ncbi:LytR/AlgR family response regulator transcription factor [Seonamhaeicola marinus]|uniref:Response regulator transcription factor n=1 Tax=Seonamhaeicola marinus TaxID=1912246 RepID=A0A5D0HL51_9FLAO|nr:response regulator transcription factor [Seonamhaeicola marinus]TYA71700.1 response regulator transcription factor [Seonamhaeicola marinus]
MIRAIAIDDEPSALDVIKIHSNKLPQLELVACYSNPKHGFEYIKNNSIDLVFLDINMPELSGLELIRKLKNKPLVIFTTAYSEFALESYDYDAVDYLMKPIEFDRFYRGVTKAITLINSSIRVDKKDYFFVKDGYKQVKVVFKQMEYAKSNGNYLDIYFDENKKTMARMTFSQLVEIVPANLLLRVHNSFMVNPKYIQKIENNQIVLNKINIPIGIRYKELVFETLNIK